MNEEDIFDIKDKVRNIERIPSPRLISLQIIIFDGNLDLERARNFMYKNNVNESIRNEGFENDAKVNDNELNARYGKVGYRTKNFKTRLGTFIPKQIEIVNDLSKIILTKIDETKSLGYVYGGSEFFIGNCVKKSLIKLARFCDCWLHNIVVPQSFVKKLLNRHKKNVEFIKIDPSKSKNYAKFKMELQNEATRTMNYEFIVKENIMKGEHIMECNAIKKLFKEELQIEVDQYKSTIYIYKNGNYKIKYELNSNGRITFYTNDNFLSNFNDDECLAAEFLLKELENDAGETIFGEDSVRLTGQLSLDLFNKNQKFQMIENHIRKQEFSAVCALVSDLEDYNITKEEQIKLFNYYVDIVQNNSIKALELFKNLASLLSEQFIEDNIENFRSILSKMDQWQFIDFAEAFIQTGHSPLINLVDEFISGNSMEKNQLKKLWIDSTKEQDKHKKGKKLEIFLMNFFCCNGNFELSKMRKLTDNEEIDIELKNKSSDSFWTQLNSPFVFVEAKNWTSKAGSPEVKLFKDKIVSHKNLCRLGFMISVNGYTDGCETEKVRIVGENGILVLINGEDINKFFNEGVSIQQFLEHMISLAIR